jgi:hypothetical protein
MGLGQTRARSTMLALALSYTLQAGLSSAHQAEGPSQAATLGETTSVPSCLIGLTKDSLSQDPGIRRSIEF